MLHIRDLEFIHLVTGRPYPLINFSHFSCDHCSGLWFYDFFKVCVCALSRVWLCIPVDCSPLGASVHGILPARILEWVAISLIRGSSQPRDHTHNSFVSCIADKFFTTETHVHVGETLLYCLGLSGLFHSAQCALGSSVLSQTPQFLIKGWIVRNFFIHLSVAGPFRCFCALAMVWIMLQQTSVQVFLQGANFISFCCVLILIYPELDHMMILFWIFWGTSILFSIMTAPICILINSVQGFPFLHLLANTCHFLSPW